MNQKLKRKWVTALLSEEFEQGRGMLRDRHDKYCCLGVLREVAGTNSDRLFMLDSTERYIVELGIDECEALGEVNDAGVPFEMIAGLIDQAL